MTDLKVLDDWDKKILLVLVLKGSMHFNKLKQTLKDMKLLSHPVLLEHLPHLLNSGYVVCEEKIVTVKGKQNMGNVYSVNKARFEKLKNDVNSQNEINKLFVGIGKKEKFFSLPINKQIETVLQILYFRRLSLLKARIAFEFTPKNLENEFAVLFWSNYELNGIEIEILKKCVEDKEYREEFLKIVEASLNMSPVRPI